MVVSSWVAVIEFRHWLAPPVSLETYMVTLDSSPSPPNIRR